VSAYFLPQPGGRIAGAVTAFIAIFVIVNHRANIGRLLKGTEKRVDSEKNGNRPGEKPRNPKR
jgi:glycerol-3-phosphate acyltransferase PlsY